MAPFNNRIVRNLPYLPANLSISLSGLFVFVRLLLLVLCLSLFALFSGKLSAQSLFFAHGPDQIVSHDSVLSVPLLGIGVEDISSMQFTLHWDPQVLDFEGVIIDTAGPVSMANIGLTEIEEGRLFFVFVDPVNPITLDVADTLFSVSLRAKGNPGSHSMFGVQSYPLELQAFGNGSFKDFHRSRIDISVIEPTDFGWFYRVCSRTGQVDSLDLSVDLFGESYPVQLILRDTMEQDTIRNEVYNMDQTILVSGLSEGTYQLLAFDSNGVRLGEEQLSLTEKDQVRATFSATDASCPQIADGTMQLETIEGTGGPFIVIWPDSSLHYREAAGFTPGLYQVEVVDRDQCKQHFPVRINGPQITTEETIQNATCPGAADGSLTSNPVNRPRFSDGTMSFSLNGQSFFRAPQLSIFSLSSGPLTYYIQDSVGCIFRQDIVIENETEIIVEERLVTPPSCRGQNDGTVQVIAGLSNSRPGAIQFDWQGSFPAITDSLLVASDLSDGTYTLSIGHSNLPTVCDIQDTFQIEGMEVIQIQNTDKEDVVCAGDSSGFVQLQLSGGEGGYSILWSTGDTTPSVENLPAGEYTVVVADSSSCIATDTFVIDDGQELTFDHLDMFNLSCPGDNSGIVRLSYTTDSAASEVRLSFLPVFRDSLLADTAVILIDSLASGVYTARLQSNIGCVTEETVIISEPDSLSADNLLIVPSDCVLPTGSVSFVVSGGNGAPYQILWNTGDTLPQLENVAAGLYHVSITDILGCQTVETIELPTIDGPTISSVIIDSILCFGEQNGSISVVIEEGIAPIDTIFWTDGASGLTRINIGAGSYQLQVIDSNECKLLETFRLNQPDSIRFMFTTRPDTSGLGVGEAEVNVSGGVPPYSYFWNTSPIQTTARATDLSAGLYEVVVIDDNRCQKTDSIRVGLVSSTSSSIYASSFTLYPVPSTGEIFLRSRSGRPLDVSAFRLLTLTGNVVFRSQPMRSIQQTSFSVPGSGWYIVEILYKSGHIEKKGIIIQQ